MGRAACRSSATQKILIVGLTSGYAWTQRSDDKFRFTSECISSKLLIIHCIIVSDHFMFYCGWKADLKLICLILHTSLNTTFPLYNTVQSVRQTPEPQKWNLQFITCGCDWHALQVVTLSCHIWEFMHNVFSFRDHLSAQKH